MKKTRSVTCLFLDIGGVLLTDGWDRHARTRAATHFELERAEMEGLGIRSIFHSDYGSTRAKLVSYGLESDERVVHETN